MCESDTQEKKKHNMFSYKILLQSLGILNSELVSVIVITMNYF